MCVQVRTTELCKPRPVSWPVMAGCGIALAKVRSIYFRVVSNLPALFGAGLYPSSWIFLSNRLTYICFLFRAIFHPLRYAWHRPHKLFPCHAYACVFHPSVLTVSDLFVASFLQLPSVELSACAVRHCYGSDLCP